MQNSKCLCEWTMGKDLDLTEISPDRWAKCGKPAKFVSPRGAHVCGTHKRTIDCCAKRNSRDERCTTIDAI